MPEELNDLTPAEVIEMATYRHDYEMEKLAWQTANLMNVHLKRRVTIDQLLGRRRGRMMPHELEEQKEKLKRIREGRRGNG